MTARPISFGWFLPTSGDSTNLGDPQARIPQSPEMFDEIVEAVVTKLLKVGEKSSGKIDMKGDGKVTEKEIEVVLEVRSAAVIPA